MKPFQIRGRFFTAVALHLSGPADAGFLAALDARLRQTPLFFENAPLVLDLEQAPQLGAELDWLMAELRARKLSVFGIQNATPAQEAAAAACGLIVLPPGRALPLERVTRPDTRSDNTRPGARATAAVAQPAPEPPPVATKLITQPVRSGQTVFADRGDLVVIGTVSSGAEIIATGNIHVYGRLRGRALAGVNGDSSARIFCNVLDAELLAIAGLYRTSENLGPDTPRSHVQVYLDGDRLQIESLN
ncbi:MULTISPECIES: septum site-determining protein MinC [unclassified Paracoccus (in: a-proteobacteria)]|uniref:septum site-determining protein MinC n=1 Tax=unclassified Paracoccus (in: a-proteobacteria) TaxID=2688777 RepID=UPI0021E12AAC|nr:MULTISPECIES: septum site-determining protein MinC [unclassified Paracoccus (in: a-proteobacteria)]UXU76647.1 septum site-determining protein MinC [Paracoccus sp. SMMA_5]UXU82536.1 septum site-determining protein MinC [Paracoccus sp. SMMA_5_TC]